MHPKHAAVPEGADDIGALGQRLQEQLVLLQYWIQTQGLKVLVILEDRGSAGQGCVIKQITERTRLSIPL